MTATAPSAGRPPRLRVALLGSRGIPARYGGFETLFEELAGRLVDRGHEVTVYCRSHYTPRALTSCRGARLVVLPTLRTKHLDTPVHTLLSSLHAMFRRFDAAVVVNASNVLFVPLLRLSGTRVALNVDGVEQRRAKWGRLGRAVFSLSERLAGRWPDALVTDARVIRGHYLERGHDSEVIAYGVDPRPVPPGATLARLGLESRGFFLYVSRFEPENNPHRVVEGYRLFKGDLPLVMVGDAPYARRFIRSFSTGDDERIRFPGSIYGEGYRELLSHALGYIQATEVGGTHPALVEAMGYGNCLVVNETPENREVAGDAALYFSAREPSTLAPVLERVVERPGEAESHRRAAAERAARLYSWSEVTRRYEALLLRLSGRALG